MNILIIEDDQFKQERVEGAIQSLASNHSLSVARSVQQAVCLIRSDVFDLIVLDIALPSHETRLGGAQPISQPSGGIEVLLELSYEGRSDKVVIVTQYPEIEFDGRLYPLARAKNAILSAVSVNIIDIIYFDAQGEQWKEKFMKAII